MQGWDFLYFTSHALSLDSLSSRGCRNFMKLINFTVTASMQILNSREDLAIVPAAMQQISMLQ